MKEIVLILAFGGLLSHKNFAQTGSTTQATTEDLTQLEVNWENFELEIDENESNWTFHTNQEQKILYIDFQALGGQMNKLVLYNAAKEIVVEDDHLFDLPENTIYEMSLNHLETGSYFIELHSHNSVIKENIDLK